MKFEWEPQDITPGLRVRATDADEQWMVCWDAEKSDTKNYWGLVSLSDGMISIKGLTTYEVSNHLNHSKLRPTSIPGAA